MTPQELKNSILQLAIQGRLVEQRPEEGTAEELYKKIQAEKQALIKAGKLKKEKPLPPITDDEKPFEIPESWMWVRFGDLGSYKKGPFGSALTKSMFVTKGPNTVKVYEQKNAIRKDATLGEYYIRQEYFESHMTGFEVHPGDVIVSCAGTIGETYILPENIEKGIINQALMRMQVFAPMYIPYFLTFFDVVLKKNAQAGSKGSAIKNIPPFEILKNYLVPIPPFAEQKRIVAKIEELLPLIDRYEKAWTRLEDFNKRFPDDMQKSILQMAIQGKLVEQRPEEGTAEDLYKQIQSEKQSLIKSGKIKKEKPLPPITDDEIPFEIPENWKWCYVGEIFDHNTGKAMNSSAKATGKKGAIRKFITTSNLYWNRFDFTSVKEMFFSDDELERCTATKNDILMCEGGAYYGRTAIWNYDYDICFQNHIHRLRAFAPISEKYIYYVFYFYRNNGMMQSKGTAMPGLSSVVLHNLIIPIPPLAEQKRIVAKIEELLPLCERLK